MTIPSSAIGPTTARTRTTLLFVIAPKGVLANDTDPNGDPLTATNVSSNTAHGTVTLILGRFAALHAR